MPEDQPPIPSEKHRNIYSINAAAKLARVSAEFVQECIREDLIQATVEEGTKGYAYDAVRRLIRIRHLQRDLGLDLTAIDCILRMRHKIDHLQKQLHDMERRMIEREQELTAEIQNLHKKMAQNSKWRI